MAESEETIEQNATSQNDTNSNLEAIRSVVRSSAKSGTSYVDAYEAAEELNMSYSKPLPSKAFELCVKTAYEEGTKDRHPTPNFAALQGACQSFTGLYCSCVIVALLIAGFGLIILILL